MKKFTLECQRKQQFLYRILPVEVPENFTLKFLLDLSYVNSLIPEDENAECSCAFGILFNYKDEKNFASLMICDNGQFRIDFLRDGTLYELIPWKAFTRKKKVPNKLRIELSEASGSEGVGVGVDSTAVSVKLGKFKFSCSFDEKFCSKGMLCAACQNYLVHEKIVAGYSSFRVRKTWKIKPAECFEKTEPRVQGESLKASSGKDSCEQISNIESKEAWNYYESSLKKYLSGDCTGALSDIVAASTELSENLAVLELYALILKKNGELERAIRLIQSNIKHSPYIEEYRIQAQKLIERLQSSIETEPFYSLDDRAEFPTKKSFIKNPFSFD